MSFPTSTRIQSLVDVVVRRVLIALLFVVAAAATYAQATDPPATSVAQAVDVRQHVKNLSALDYAVRMQAARLIRRAPEREAVTALSEAARRDPDEFVRYRALVLLTAFNDRGTPDLMRELMRDRNDRVREVVYKWLERHPDERLAPSLLMSLQTEESEFVRPALVSALAALGADPAVRRALIAEIPRGLDFFRSAVIEALGRHRAGYAVDGIAATGRLDGPLQDDALLALGRIGDARATMVLRELGPTTVEAKQMVRGVRCLLGDGCQEHLAALESTASSEEARPAEVRGAIDALAAVAMERNEAALVSLTRLGSTKSAIRERIAVAVSSVALRQPDWVMTFIESLDEAAREPVVMLVKDGFDSLEDDFDEEQFFAAVRAGYWRAAEGSPTRALAAMLIQRLEF